MFRGHLFDRDEYPGQPRVLFVGLPLSSHTHSWIDLIDGAGLNIRLFALPPDIPPVEWGVKTYLTGLTPPVRLDAGTRHKLYLTNNVMTPLVWLWDQSLSRFSRLNSGFFHKWLVDTSEVFQPNIVPQSLAWVIDRWRPTIVHTLGFEPASYLYHTARKYVRTKDNKPVWVAQVRGGPDFALYRFLPGWFEKIANVLRDCDQFIADNNENYQLAQAMGLQSEKKSSLGVVPGTGGIDVAGLSKCWDGLPSRRERVILWPKAYEAPSSKALPVLEALKLIWNKIKPCRVQMLWVVQSEIQMWLETLPKEIRESCEVYDRMSRDFVLSLMAKARVMLAPSLTDGVPNTMLEAMASGAFPIVSPLNTITPIVEDEKNVLFARNLYPSELAKAMERAMNDDTLIDSAAERNLELVRRIGDRQAIRMRVINYYKALASKIAG